MIPEPIAGHDTTGEERVVKLAASVADDRPTGVSHELRLRRAVTEHTQFLWRSARRFGVRERDVEDVVQRAWIIFSEKLDEVREGAERAYAVAITARLASHQRRSYGRKQEELGLEVEPIDPNDAPSADELADRKVARQLLDVILDAMDDEARAVFVLFELEGLDTAAIATALEIPQGTVKSRLRRAREVYEARVARLRADQRRTP